MTTTKSRFGKAWALALGLGIGVAAVAFSQPSLAREFGLEDQPGGGTNGSSADNIPVGIFMVDQFFTDQQTIATGPGAPFLATGGKAPNLKVFVNAEVFIFNPGWTFLGATTQFIIAQPFVEVDQGNNPGPFGTTSVGVNDTLFKADAAWKFGDWHVKLALGAWAPTGTQQGPAGLNNVGLPVWTIQPEFVLSWEPESWNFTAYTYWEIYTENPITHYQSAPAFHADFTATKTFGKWTIGPVADFVTQVGNDTSSAFYSNLNNGGCAINPAIGQPAGFQCLFGDLTRWYVGGLIQYNFGPVTLQFWATDIVYSNSSGASLVAAPVLHDPAADQHGYTLWFQASYALWTPPEAPPAEKHPLIYK
jgi:hypothetical protein